MSGPPSGGFAASGGAIATTALDSQDQTGDPMKGNGVGDLELETLIASRALDDGLDLLLDLGRAHRTTPPRQVAQAPMPSLS